MPKITKVMLQHSQVTNDLHHVSLSFKGDGTFSYATPFEIIAGDGVNNNSRMIIYSISSISMALSGLEQSTSSNHFCAFMHDDDNEIDIVSMVPEYEEEDMDLGDEDEFEPDDEEDR
jgi:hypothetical protein